MRRITFAAVSLAVTFVCAPAAAQITAPDAGVTVPMFNVGGRPVIEVSIDGAGPYRMILDTGASRTVVDPAWAGGAQGTVTLKHVKIGALEIGSLNAASMALFGGTLPPEFPRGVFSALSFPGYVLELNYPAATVTIRKGALPAADGRRVFEYAAGLELPRVPLVVGGKTYDVDLDSGAPGALMLPRTAADEVALAAPLASVGRARTPGGEFEVFGAPVRGPVTLGEFTLDVPMVRFSDLGPGAEPGPGNLGFEVLRSYVVSVDVANRRVALHPR